MSVELIGLLVTLFVLSGIGTPIGYAIMLAAVVYLGIAGLDVALAGEKILQGFYKSAILLAVPLFIVAANIMNAGSITDRLLAFCVAAVGRFKGGLGHVNVVASLIFSGMSGSAVADAAGTAADAAGCVGIRCPQDTGRAITCSITCELTTGGWVDEKEGGVGN